MDYIENCSEHFSDDVELGSLPMDFLSVVLDVTLFCGAENKLPILEVQGSDGLAQFPYHCIL